MSDRRGGGGPGRGPRRALLLGLALALFGVALPLRAQSGYVACLGCAEHQEMRTRWHRPFALELAGEGLLMFDHFRLERQASRMGLCETDLLIRTPLAPGGCHAFSSTRAWLIEAPLELVLFTSPAWGLERRGHPRWAMALELAPIVYHGLAARSTIHAIHEYQRLQYLYR